MYGYTRDRSGQYTGIVCGVRVTAGSKADWDKAARQIEKRDDWLRDRRQAQRDLLKRRAV